MVIILPPPECRPNPPALPAERSRFNSSDNERRCRCRQTLALAFSTEVTLFPFVPAAASPFAVDHITSAARPCIFPEIRKSPLYARTATVSYQSSEFFRFQRQFQRQNARQATVSNGVRPKLKYDMAVLVDFISPMGIVGDAAFAQREPYRGFLSLQHTAI